MSLVEDIKLALSRGFDVSEIGVALPYAKCVEDEIVDTTRWFIIHEAVWADDSHYAIVSYSEPATEYQDADDEPVDVYAAEPYTETVIKYRKV